MKIDIKVFALLMVFFLSATSSAQDIPANAWKSGNIWYCNDDALVKSRKMVLFEISHIIITPCYKAAFGKF